eukprot:GEMP01028050.1.p1 GENE.GEMP01028050.1~~GEMP01028050.1.p1  ORF type:complete len:577 (+),score=94.47 GEMP01028050.1:126-1856(+)
MSTLDPRYRGSRADKMLNIRRVNSYSYARLNLWFASKTVKECVDAINSLLAYEGTCLNGATRASIDVRWRDQRGAHAFRQLRSNADPTNWNTTNQNLAHVAAGRGYSTGGSYEVLRMMEIARMPLNLVDCYGQTPLFFAARECDAASCRLLIAAKCSADRIDCRLGETCVFYAVRQLNYLEDDRENTPMNRQRRCATIDLLLKEGCSFKTVNEDGQTLLDIAADTGDAYILQFMKRREREMAKEAKCTEKKGAKRTQQKIATSTANKKPRLSLTIDGDDSSTDTNLIEVTMPARPPTDHCVVVSRLKNMKILDLVSEVANPENRYFYCCSTTDSDLGDQDTFAEKERISQDMAACKARPTVKFRVGISCRKGLKFNTPNQDSFSVFHVPGMFSLYGVFDGHGAYGHVVSDFVKEILPKLFLRHSKRVTEPEVALQESFTSCQKLIDAQTKARLMDAITSGTTATLVYRPCHEKYMIVAHVGNSLASLICKGKRVVSLTQGHRPDDQLERHRIENCGGAVVFDGSRNFRVYSAVAGDPVPTPCGGFAFSAFQLSHDITSTRAQTSSCVYARMECGSS